MTKYITAITCLFLSNSIYIWSLGPEQFPRTPPTLFPLPQHTMKGTKTRLKSRGRDGGREGAQKLAVLKIKKIPTTFKTKF